MTIDQLKNAMYGDSFYKDLEEILSKRLNKLSLELNPPNDKVLNELAITTLALYGLKKLKENGK